MGGVRRIMLWVGVLLVIAIAAAYMLPRHVRVQRSATVAASRSTVFTISTASSSSTGGHPGASWIPRRNTPSRARRRARARD